MINYIMFLYFKILELYFNRKLYKSSIKDL